MRCSKTLKYTSLHLDGRISAGQERRLQRHSANCLRCRELRKTMEELVLEIRGLPRLDAPADLATRVERLIASSAGAPPLRSRRLSYRLGGSLAAVALLTAFFAFFPWQDFRVPRIIVDQPVTAGRGAAIEREKSGGTEVSEKGDFRGTEKASNFREIVASVGGIIKRRRETERSLSLLIELPAALVDELFRQLRSVGLQEMPTIPERQLSRPTIRLRLIVPAAE